MQHFYTKIAKYIHITVSSYFSITVSQTITPFLLSSSHSVAAAPNQHGIRLL